jgi:hydroxylamine reductase (hybrid-cluster protein)
MTETPTRVCASCGIAKPWTDYVARQKTCVACIQAKRARTQERREQIAYTPALGEKIADALASGSTVAEVCEQSAMPTPRQLRAMRRANPDFDAAMLQAEAESASAHVHKAKEVLRQLEAGKIPGSDAKTLFDGHMKLASTLNPSRYGSQAVALDLTSAGRPLVDVGAALKALIDALPSLPAALPAPTPIDAEAVPVVTETIQ